MIAYLICFVIELAGMALILWDGVPIFRSLLRFQQIATAYDETVLTLGVICIQSTYWKWLRHNPPFNMLKLPFAGHVVLFISRLSFIFASAIFSFVVYRASDMFEFRFIGSLLGALVLFSVFLFSRHIEKIGNLMLTGYRA